MPPTPASQPGPRDHVFSRPSSRRLTGTIFDAHSAGATSSTQQTRLIALEFVLSNWTTITFKPESPEKVPFFENT